MIEQHIGDFPARLKQFTLAAYDFCPIPSIHYSQLNKEIYVHEYYLRWINNVCFFICTLSSLAHPPPHSFSLSLSLSLSFSLILSLSLSLILSFSLSLSHSHSLSLSLSLSLPISLSLSLSLFILLSLPPYVSLYLSIFLSIYLCLTLFPSFTLRYHHRSGT